MFLCVQELALAKSNAEEANARADTLVKEKGTLSQERAQLEAAQASLNAKVRMMIFVCLWVYL